MYIYIWCLEPDHKTGLGGYVSCCSEELLLAHSLRVDGYLMTGTAAILLLYM